MVNEIKSNEENEIFNVVWKMEFGQDASQASPRVISLYKSLIIDNPSDIQVWYNDFVERNRAIGWMYDKRPDESRKLCHLVIEWRKLSQDFKGQLLKFRENYYILLEFFTEAQKKSLDFDAIGASVDSYLPFVEERKEEALKQDEREVILEKRVEIIRNTLVNQIKKKPYKKPLEKKLARLEAERLQKEQEEAAKLKLEECFSENPSEFLEKIVEKDAQEFPYGLRKDGTPKRKNGRPKGAKKGFQFFEESCSITKKLS